MYLCGIVCSYPASSLIWGFQIGEWRPCGLFSKWCWSILTGCLVYFHRERNSGLLFDYLEWYAEEMCQNIWIVVLCLFGHWLFVHFLFDSMLQLWSWLEEDRGFCWIENYHLGNVRHSSHVPFVICTNLMNKSGDVFILSGIFVFQYCF